MRIHGKYVSLHHLSHLLITNDGIFMFVSSEHEVMHGKFTLSIITTVIIVVVPQMNF